MKISDAIERLNGYLADDLFDPPQEDLDAMELAVDILSALEANRAKAEAIITRSKICRGAIPGGCQNCPYYRYCKSGVASGYQIELDTERLLELAYLQGGDSDDQT